MLILLWMFLNVWKNELSRKINRNEDPLLTPFSTCGEGLGMRYHSAFHPKAQIFFDWQVFWLACCWIPSHLILVKQWFNIQLVNGEWWMVSITHNWPLTTHKAYSYGDSFRFSRNSLLIRWMILYLAATILLSFVVSLPSAFSMWSSNYSFVENDCTYKRQVHKPWRGGIIIE